MHRIQTLFFALIAAFALFFAAIPQVFAQDQPSITLKNTVLSVNPEYDDPLQFGFPSVLVMYEGEIVSNNLSKITFLVPSDAEMYSAGSGPRSQYTVGDSLNTSGTSNITGWKEVSFIPRTNYFVVEYYMPARGEPDRFIPFDFRTVYPISNMRVIIQEPRRSTNFNVSPEGTVGSDQEGFKVHIYNNPTVTPDQPLLYNITYTKQDANPSQGASGSGASSNGTLILIVIGAIIVLGAVLFFLPQFRSKPQRGGSRSQRRQAEREARKAQGKSKFCRYCGKPVQDTDRFCPHCGQPL
ncbi:MAG: zinc ribbon domain-containing protein [Dehalococcoidales bacterium]|nr:zinc ribbon domain-containing protein [Dehalococcoidales bacterium]